MIYFAFAVYDQKTLAHFAPCYHHRDRNTADSNRFFVRTHCRSRIKQRGNRQCDTHTNSLCRGNFTSRINRLDHVDGGHHRTDRRNTRITQACNLDKMNRPHPVPLSM